MLEYTLRTYQSPTRLVQRLGAIKELGTEAGLLGMRRPLLVTDAGVKAAGLLDTALEALRGSDIEPWVALIDPELTVKLPAVVTAGTGMDALAHAVECFTMVYHQPFTDAVALLAMEYVARYLRVAFSQANNLEARYHMSAAAMLAGLAYGTDPAGAPHATIQTAGRGHH